MYGPLYYLYLAVINSCILRLSLPSEEFVARYALLGEKLSLNTMYEFES
jgi:hypothetical protein